MSKNHHREAARLMRLQLRTEREKPFGQRDPIRILKLGTWIAERVTLAKRQDEVDRAWRAEQRERARRAEA